MQPLRASTWGPLPLPELLLGQLESHGLAPGDAGECARQINVAADDADAIRHFVDLGSCKFLEGDIDGAIALWRHAITSDHDDSAAQALFNLGLLYEHLHLHHRAIAAFGSVNERTSESYSGQAVMACARCYQAVGDTDSAMETMARLAHSSMALGSNPDELAESLLGLGEIATEAGRPDRAERAWRAASAAPPSASQQAAVERLLSLLVEHGHDDELTELLEHHPQGLSPSNIPALLERVEALHRAGSADQAIALATTIDGGQLAPTERFRLADVRRQVGLINEAIDELEALLAHNHDEVRQRAGFLLGGIYRTHGMPDAAMDMFERVMHESDGYWSPKAALALGDLLAQNGKYDHASDHWAYAAASKISAVSETASERLSELAVQQGLGNDLDLRALDVLEPDSGENQDEIQVLSLDLLVDEAGQDEMQVLSLDLLVPDEVTSEPHVILLDGVDDIDQPVVHELPAPTPLTVASQTVAPTPTKPAVIVLSDLEELNAEDPSVVVEPKFVEASLASASNPPDQGVPVSIVPSGFSALSDSNPYAVLAPDLHETDVAPSGRNPYAELAPKFDDDVSTSNEPGDWESMLDSWPKTSDETTPPPAKRSSAFSRHT